MLVKLPQCETCHARDNMAKTWLTGNRFVSRISSNVGGFFVIFTLSKTI